jgi:Arc-like DNA binding domain
MKGPLKRDKRLTVRIPEAVLDRLRVVALADGRSISDWALRAIEREISLAEVKLAKRRKSTTSKSPAPLRDRFPQVLAGRAELL